MPPSAPAAWPSLLPHVNTIDYLCAFALHVSLRLSKLTSVLFCSRPPSQLLLFALSSLARRAPTTCCRNLARHITTAYLLRDIIASSIRPIMDEQQYLEPGFDPNSLTVPRLRSILLAHNVNYPASAKKPQLVELFSQNVASQAKKIKSDSLRVKRSSRGIVDVPSAASSVRDDEEEEEPPHTVTRSSRRTTRARTEEAEDVKPTPRRVRHSTAPPEGTPRRASSKHAHAAEKVEEEEEEPEPKRPASRKSRASVATPAVKRERDDASPFSNDNVFQSGGSPPPATENRRRTLHITSEEASRRRSRDARRRTEELRPARQQMDGAVVPTKRTFEMPVSKFRKEEVEPDEEFTPEEQLDLVQAEQAGEVVPARRRPARPASGAAKTAPVAILGAILIAFGALWGDEKFNVGYCGVGVPSNQIAGTEIPEWADVLRPQCEPCPPHATCNERLETACEPGFVVTHHPLSLGGLLPIPPTCEPDSVRARKVEAVKERAVEELREQNALYECGEAASPDIQESALKSAVSSQKRKSMSQEEFDELWADVEDELRKVDEITTGSGG